MPKETGELLGDLTQTGEKLLVAAGGEGRQGKCALQVEHQPRTAPVNAGHTGRESYTQARGCRCSQDVGLLGMPNAGKSTLIRAVSAARPKIADYPFTTLYPNLGVVSIEAHRSFVMADIPGLIEGAAEGAGLGIRFLKHLRRTRLLLHLIERRAVGGNELIRWLMLAPLLRSWRSSVPNSPPRSAG